SPSSRPSIVVSPTASRPNNNARCEIDLSPGIRARPRIGPERCAASGAREETVQVTAFCSRKRAGGGQREALACGLLHVTAPQKLDFGLDSYKGAVQWERPFPTIIGAKAVAKPELGIKRQCGHCG